MRTLILLAVLLLIGATAQAKDLYVDNSGACSDTTTYAANSQASPWCTVQRAAWGSTSRAAQVPSQAAQAGDVVLVAAGTYSAPGSETRLNPAFNPANSGIQGFPITFRAVGTVYLTLNEGTTGPVFGAYLRDYITWEGFTVDESSYTPYGGERSMGVCWMANYTTLRGNRLIGTTLGEGNHAGLRSEDSNGCLMENNVISDVRSSGDLGNTEGILAYTSTNLTIRHNHIYDCSQGIFIKGGNTGPVTISHNLVHDISANGIYLLGLDEAGNDGGSRVFQNIVYNAYAGLTFNSISGGPNGVTVANNVFDSTVWAGYLSTALANTDNTIQNNIFSNASEFGWAIPWAYSGTFAINRNLYYAAGTLFRVNYASYSLAQWQSTFGHDLNGLVADPLFTNRTARDYTLQAGSPALTLGRDILNLSGYGETAIIPAGAYISPSDCIGACAPTPSCATDPALCASQSACQTAGWYWCDGVCQVSPCPLPPEPTCADTPSLCLTQAACETASWHWCDGACQAAECSAPPPVLIRLFNGRISFGGSIITFGDS